jgi:hypothetical protein
MRMSQLVALSGLALCIVLTCAGCSTVSLSQVKQFGAATSSLAENTQKAFQLAATASVDRNLYAVAGDPKKGPTDSTFEGLFTGDVGSLDGKEKAQRLTLRLNALDGLAKYANALQQLTEADFSSDIDAAATKLNGSLVGLVQTYKKASGKDLPITDEDIGIISTAVDAIGKVIVEAKRRAAIKTIIVKTDPAVQNVAKLIASDLGSDSELASFVKEAMSNSRGSVQQAYNLERERPTSSFDVRYAMLLRARQLYDAEMTTPALFTALSEGAKATAKAHQALREAVQSGAFSSAQLALLIGELDVCSKSVQAFYKTLETK